MGERMPCPEQQLAAAIAGWHHTFSVNLFFLLHDVRLVSATVMGTPMLLFFSDQTISTGRVLPKDTNLEKTYYFEVGI
jgi:hypothetical protein